VRTVSAWAHLCKARSNGPTLTHTSMISAVSIRGEVWLVTGTSDRSGMSRRYLPRKSGGMPRDFSTYALALLAHDREAASKNPTLDFCFGLTAAYSSSWRPPT